MRHAKTLLTGASLGALLVGSLFYAAERGVLPALPALPLLVDTAEASTPPASEPASQPAPAGPPVGVAAAEARAITRWDEFTGRFEAVDEVAIRARVSGYLDAVHFRPGQVVEKGDLLFTIDPRPFEATVAEAGARLE
ncbi:MAG: biotin/lipoyl-binding protein, partial [Pseudomonadota bacterium]